jgi:hypothetical protein
LNLGNCLFSGLEQVFEAAESSSWSGVAEHVTVDHVDILAPDPTRSTYALRFTNSILSQLYNLTPPPTANSSVGGDHNGFDANTPQFGLNPTVDSRADSPFAPQRDPNTSGYSLANYQGLYYLRTGSPFVGIGAPVVSTPLQSEMSGAPGPLITFKGVIYQQ